MPIPLIIGATVIGGVLYLLSSEDEKSEGQQDSQDTDNTSEEVLLSTEKIRALRASLRKEEKRRKQYLKQVELSEKDLK